MGEVSNEYKVEIGIGYDEVSLEKLRTNLEKIQKDYKDIKINVDTSQLDKVNKTLENIKTNLKSIDSGKYNININTNNSASNTSTSKSSGTSKSKTPTVANAKEIKKVETLLNKTQAEINKTKKELSSLNMNGVVKSVKSFSNQIDNVNDKCKSLAKSIKSGMSISELNKVSKSLETIDNKRKNINSSIKNSKKEAFGTIRENIKNKSIQSNINNLDIEKSNLQSNTDKSKLYKKTVTNIKSTYTQLENAINNNDKEKAIALQERLNVKFKEAKSLLKEIKKENVTASNQKASVGEISKVNNELNSILNKLGKTKSYLKNLNAETPVGDFKTLNKQITNTETKVNDLINSLNSDISVGGLDKVSNAMQKLSNEVNLIDSNIANSKSKIFNNISNKVNGGNYKSAIESYKIRNSNLTEFSGDVLGYKNEIDNNIVSAETKHTQLQTAVDNGDTEKAIKLNKELNSELYNISSSYRIARTVQSNFFKTDSLETKKINALKEIDKIINSNSVASKRYNIALNSIRNNLKNATGTDIQPVINQWIRLKKEINTSGLAVESFISRMKYQFRRLSTYITAAFIIDKLQQSLRVVYNNVTEIDKAMTELYRVTSLTPEQYTNLYSNMISTAKEYGSTLTSIINSTSEWAKLGFDATTSDKLAGITTMYQNITDVDTATAVNDLISAYKGFQGQLDELYSGDQAKAVEYVSDIYNELGNNFALSASNLGSALERSASSLSLAGNTIQESAAMATGITEVTQDSERAGSALKILALRLRGTSAKEMENLGEETDGLVETTSKLKDTILTLTNNKVNIELDDGSYKSTYQIIKEISDIYGELTDKQQAGLLETIAGKSRSNDISALISNFSQVENAYNSAMNAEGSARKENEIYMTHIEARTKVLKTNLQSLSNNVLNSDVISNTIGGLSNIVDSVDKLISNVGLLPPLLGTINTYLMVSKGTNIFSSTLTLLKDIPGYLSSITVGFSELKGMSFGDTKQLSIDVKSINERNKLISQGVDYIDANAMAMVNASVGAKDLAQNVGNNAVKMDDLAKKTNTTTSTLKAATIATNLLNVAISVGVTALIAGAIYGLDKLASKQGDIAEKAIDSYEKANDKLSDTKTKIEKVNSLIEEYNNLITKSDNTNKDTTLNNNGRKEALEIQNQIVDLIGSEANKYDLVNGKLEDRLKSLKEINKELGKENVENSVNAMNKSINAKNKAVVGEKASIFGLLTDTGGYNRVYNGYADKTLTNELKTNNVKYSYTNSYFGAGASSGVWTNDIKINLDENDTAEEKLSKLNDIKSAFESAKTKIKKQKYKDKYQKAIDSIDAEIDKIDNLVVESSKLKANAISDLIDYNVNTNNNFSNKKLTSATEYENYRNKLTDEIKNNKDIKSAIDKKEISTKDIYKQIDDYMSSVDEFSRGYNEWILHQDVEGLDKTKEIKKSFKKNKKSYTKEIDSFNKWISKLNSKEIDYVYQISLDTESAEYNLEEWQRQLEYAKNGSLEDKASIEDFYGIFGKTDDDSFVSKIQNYQDKLSSLQDVLSKYKSGELTDNDLTDLILKYPQLINYTDDLDIGINKLIDNITGSAKDGTGIMSEFNDQIETLGENSVGGKKMIELRDRILEVSKVAKDGIVINITTEMDRYTNIANAISESTSGSGLSTQSIESITNMYKNIKGFDASKIFEKTANGIILNTQELEKLQLQYEKTNKTATQKELDTLVNKYNALTEEINNTTDAKKRAELIGNQNKLKTEIKDVEELAIKYGGLTSQYLKYVRAKSNQNQGYVYDDIYANKDYIEDLYKKGLTGTDDFREYVKLITNTDMTNATNQDYINEYKKSIAKQNRYLTESALGSQNFLKDISKTDKNLASVDKNGNWKININTEDFDRIAKSLGVSKEFVEITLNKLKETGIDINFGSVENSIKTVETNLVKSAEKLKDKKLTTFEFDFSSTDLEDLDNQIMEATKVINKFKGKNGKIDLTIDGAVEAKNVLQTLIDQRNQISNSNSDLFKVDTTDLKTINSQLKQSVSNISKAQGFTDKLKAIGNTTLDLFKNTSFNSDYQINNVLDTLIKIKNIYDEIQKRKAVGEDTSKYEEALNKQVNFLSKLNPTIKTQLSLNETNVKTIINSISNLDTEILTKFNVDDDEVVKFKKESHDIDATVNYKVNENVIRTYTNSHGQKITMSKNGNVTTRTTVNKDGSKVIESTMADGSARSYAEGSAYAQGNWGLKNDGTALVGEVAPEILVRNGKWKLIGENGAEFIKYRKNDIIFNGKQTQEILKYGKIINGKSRGRALASGTAFAPGTNNLFNGADSVSGSGTLGNVDSAYIKSDTEKPFKSILEKFQDWLSSLFDWIEIKLERQTDKIQKYLDQAQYSLDSKNYSNSIVNYRNAIKSTNTQIGYEQIASSKYNNQANKVMSKAISMGVITKKQANTIKNGIKNGYLNISAYSDKIREVISAYQEWYNKSKQASDSIKELHYNIRTYIQDLKETANAQRDATLNRISQRETVGSSGSTYLPYQQNDKIIYNNKVKLLQQKAYSSVTKTTGLEVLYNKKGTVANTTTSSIGSALKSSNSKKYYTYRKALLNARKYIKNKTKIPTSILKVIGRYNSSTYNYCYAYNLAVDNYQLAKLEEAVNYASVSSDYYDSKFEAYSNNKDYYNNQISLLNSKSNNSTSVNKKNAYLDNVIVRYKNIVVNDTKAIKNSQSTINSSYKQISGKGRAIKTSLYNKSSTTVKKNVNALIKNILAYAKSRKSIPSSLLDKCSSYYAMGYVSASYYTSCINYNNALAKKNEYQAQLEIDKQTLIEQKASIGTQKFENVSKEWQNILNNNESKTTKISNKQAIRTTKGGSLGVSDYTALISQNQRKGSILSNMSKALKKQASANLKSGLWTTSNQEYKDAMQTIKDYDNQVLETLQEQQELINSLQTLDLTNLEKAVSLLSKYQSYLESITSLMKAQNKTIKAEVYQNQVDNNLKQISQKEKQAVSAWNKYLIANADTDKAYAGKSADEWKEYYYEVLSDINNLKSSNETLYDSIWQTYLQPFDDAIDKFKNYISLLESTRNLLNVNNLINKDGSFASDGIAQMSSYLKNIDIQRQEITKYQEAINQLNKMYNNGISGLSEKEYKDKLREYQTGLIEVTSQEKEITNSLIDMWVQASQVELDNLNKIIDKRKKALENKKSYYEYDKNIKEQTKDIQSLQAQIAALDGVATAEARAEKARLEAQMSEANDNLQDVIQEHLYDIKVEGLDELQTTLQENYDNYVDELKRNYDKMSDVVSDSANLVSNSYFEIKQAFEDAFTQFGVNSSYLTFNGYASGTKKAKKDELAWTQEKGSEIIIRKSDGAILTPLKSGDGVIPNNLTENLFEWGKNTPSEFVDKLGFKSVQNIPTSTSNIPSINIEYDSLLNVQGDVTRDTLPSLQRILEQSYDYTKEQIIRDARKGGLKP